MKLDSVEARNHQYTIEEKLINLCDLMCRHSTKTVRNKI